MSINKKQLHKGFSLVETLVAISILLISIAAPLTIASKSLHSNYFSGDQLTAVLLAQEGIEIVVNRQREGIAAHVNSGGTDDPLEWFTSLPADCTDRNHGCPMQVIGGTAASAVDIISESCTDSPDECQLYFDDTQVRSPYNHDAAGEPTIYTRSIKVLSDNGGDEVMVESTVSWVSPLFPSGYEVTLRSSLHDITATSI